MVKIIFTRASNKTLHNVCNSSILNLLVCIAYTCRLTAVQHRWIALDIVNIITPASSYCSKRTTSLPLMLYFQLKLMLTITQILVKVSIVLVYLLTNKWLIDCNDWAGSPLNKYRYSKHHKRVRYYQTSLFSFSFIFHQSTNMNIIKYYRVDCKMKNTLVSLSWLFLISLWCMIM